MGSRIIGASALATCCCLWLLVHSGLGHGQERIVRPGTDLAEETLRLLERARFVDQMNAQSTSSSNPTLDRSYAAKVAEIDGLIDRLERGKPVSLDEADNALDNRAARLLGGYLWTVPGTTSF